LYNIKLQHSLHKPGFDSVRMPAAEISSVVCMKPKGPNVFSKSTPHRVVGNKGFVRIRKDSIWNVPEPELTLVVTISGKIIGYTTGNDMSSRSIEGEKPFIPSTGKNI